MTEHVQTAQILNFVDFRKSRQHHEAATFCDNRSLNQCIDLLSERVFEQWYTSVRIDHPVDENEADITESMIDNVRATFQIPTNEIHHHIEVGFNIRMTAFERRGAIRAS